MISTEQFAEILLKHNVTFFTGVPDSLLKDFCAYLTLNMAKEKHIIAANEGGAIGLAVGHHLATNSLPLVYMQNSGLGNCVNPLLSIAAPEVYSIPMLLLIGWRGKPGAKDEPQHAKQGLVTNDLLKAMNIPFAICSSSWPTLQEQVKIATDYAVTHQCTYAIVVPPKTFAPFPMSKNEVDLTLTRERALEIIIKQLKQDDIIISTTGKTSRELFELRDNNNMPHHNDFLNIGGMGHTVQIGLSIALAKPGKRVFCIDGDGSALMHLGSWAINGSIKAKNFYHILINNGSHESVGGQPTAGFVVDFPLIAKGCGYNYATTVDSENNLLYSLGDFLNASGPALFETKTRTGSRKDLSRPNTSPLFRKQELMKALND